MSETTKESGSAAGREFPTLAVMGVFTGRVLEEKGMGGIHEVMDHFYPGIMTIGVAAMQPTAALEVGRQIPNAPPWREGDDWRDYGTRALAALGPTCTIVGPHHVTEQQKTEAFAAFGKATP